MRSTAREHAYPGFTITEFLVVAGIFVILLAIFVPYLMKVRETSRRAGCNNNLRQIGSALRAYAGDNRYDLPRVVYDEKGNANGYTAFTGPDAPSPFVAGSAVKPNDVTASLWLLLRGGYVKDPAVFVCPSSSEWPDGDGDAKSRSNFRGGLSLSYSYATPFSNAFNYRLNTDQLPADFAVMADKNPGVGDGGFTADGTRVTSPAHDAPPFELAKGNSSNHAKAGQNVLYVTGDVAFQSTPYCGVREPGARDGDNIYTAQSSSRLAGQHTAATTPGFIGKGIGPAYAYDSYLVPTADEGK